MQILKFVFPTIVVDDVKKIATQACALSCAARWLQYINIDGLWPTLF